MRTDLGRHSSAFICVRVSTSGERDMNIVPIEFRIIAIDRFTLGWSTVRIFIELCIRVTGAENISLKRDHCSFPDGLSAHLNQILQTSSVFRILSLQRNPARFDLFLTRLLQARKVADGQHDGPSGGSEIVFGGVLGVVKNVAVNFSGGRTAQIDLMRLSNVSERQVSKLCLKLLLSILLRPNLLLIVLLRLETFEDYNQRQQAQPEHFDSISLHIFSPPQNEPSLNGRASASCSLLTAYRLLRSVSMRFRRPGQRKQQRAQRRYDYQPFKRDAPAIVLHQRAESPTGKHSAGVTENACEAYRGCRCTLGRQICGGYREQTLWPINKKARRAEQRGSSKLRLSRNLPKQINRNAGEYHVDQTHAHSAAAEPTVR